MGRIGFWGLLLDPHMSWWEAERINGAYDAAEMAASAAEYTASSLGQRIDQQAREIVMLRTALTVLTQTLKDTKVLDERLLEARFEAALDEAQAAQPRRTAGGQLNAALHEAGPAAQAPMLTCVRCRKHVLASSTLMTGDGPMCERCP